MFLLLHLLLRPIRKRPLHHIRFGGGTLDVFAFLQFTPEDVEVLEFDQVPDLGEGRGDDGAFGYGG